LKTADVADVLGLGFTVPLERTVSGSMGVYYEPGNFFGTVTPYFTIAPLTYGRMTFDVTIGVKGANISDFSGNGWISAITLGSGPIKLLAVLRCN
jgi:hypothetical protein